jgi:hypothetical protein
MTLFFAFSVNKFLVAISQKAKEVKQQGEVLVGLIV